jgi:hypothetical protein
LDADSNRDRSGLQVYRYDLSAAECATVNPAM